MICPKCRFQNPEQVDFCHKCATMLKPPAQDLTLVFVIMTLVVAGAAFMFVYFLSNKLTDFIKEIEIKQEFKATNSGTPKKTKPLQNRNYINANSNQKNINYQYQPSTNANIVNVKDASVVAPPLSGLKIEDNDYYFDLRGFPGGVSDICKIPEKTYLKFSNIGSGKKISVNLTVPEEGLYDVNIYHRFAYRFNNGDVSQLDIIINDHNNAPLIVGSAQTNNEQVKCHNPLKAGSYLLKKGKNLVEFNLTQANSDLDIYGIGIKKL